MMTPREIVHELNKHIVGQDRAKQAVAVALRNRWRRQRFLSAIATARFARAWPTMCLSSSWTISCGVIEDMGSPLRYSSVSTTIWWLV